MESIYNWIEEEQVEQIKPPMYRSQHDKDRKVASSFGGKKASTGTFGRLNNKPNPKNFLRGSRKSTEPRPTPGKWNRQRLTTPKPSVPRRDQKPVMGLTTTKNFVVANAVENILAVPKQPARKRPNYLGKKDYGKTPEYLRMVKQDIEDEKRVIEEYFSRNESQKNDRGGDLLGAQERAQLCAQLKIKWDDTNKQYQRITHNTKLDTISKVKKKEKYEKDLDQLEKDIKLLSNKRPIVIVEY
jgi:hypothetical protein